MLVWHLQARSCRTQKPWLGGQSVHPRLESKTDGTTETLERRNRAEGSTRPFHHAFVGVNSEAIAVTTPVTMATTPKSTMSTGTKNFREANKRSVRAGSYFGEPFRQAALASRNSTSLDFMCNSGGRIYPTACSQGRWMGGWSAQGKFGAG